MSLTYIMSKHQHDIIHQLEQNKIPGLTMVHQPNDPITGEPSLWPYGVKDKEQNHGWFEHDMILFWGTNNPTLILQAFHQVGIQTRYLG